MIGIIIVATNVNFKRNFVWTFHSLAYNEKQFYNGGRTAIFSSELFPHTETLLTKQIHSTLQTGSSKKYEWIEYWLHKLDLATLKSSYFEI